MVISRSVETFGHSELTVGHTKPIHHDEASSSTVKLVAMIHGTEQLAASSSSSGASPIKQRNWNCVPYVTDSCFKIWRRMTRILRYCDDLREVAG